MVTRHRQGAKVVSDSEFSGDFTWDESFCGIFRLPSQI